MGPTRTAHGTRKGASSGACATFLPHHRRPHPELRSGGGPPSRNPRTMSPAIARRRAYSVMPALCVLLAGGGSRTASRVSKGGVGAGSFSGAATRNVGCGVECCPFETASSGWGIIFNIAVSRGDIVSRYRHPGEVVEVMRGSSSSLPTGHCGRRYVACGVSRFSCFIQSRYPSKRPRQPRRSERGITVWPG